MQDKHSQSNEADKLRTPPSCRQEPNIRNRDVRKETASAPQRNVRSIRAKFPENRVHVEVGNILDLCIK